ncbi:GSCFA domain-containing protein [Brevibacterium sp. CT2-23B]|uniref:GSCFA domain-containing protein n=1 Tax=Brevibacterium sp. CT2-23B TaxID=2729630 RepID=UPI001555BF34|nr:GSCFA domain-containing protein [Brevibacterium sp. CT2-23B]
MAENPYKNLPDKAFWKRAVASRHFEELAELWTPPKLTGDEKFATAGSCFAQHIGRHVSARGYNNYLDLEPAPPTLPESEYAKFGFGIYSCRYGNIYTSRQLVQLIQEAFGHRQLSEHIWTKDGRYYDALRPSIDPIGQESQQLVRSLRAQHLENVRKMFSELDVMVFTLGLTETWISRVDGTAYPTAPGVIAGSLDEAPVDFVNLSIDEVRNDLNDFWSLLKSVNPQAKMILTVSPVPLIATASEEHVLPATTYSKSVLRTAAGEMASTFSEVSYFPSYEIINSPQGGGYYFDPDLRSVNDRGVQYVMSHFFSGDMQLAFPARRNLQGDSDGGDVVCDEEAIETSIK